MGVTLVVGLFAVVSGAAGNRLPGPESPAAPPATAYQATSTPADRQRPPEGSSTIVPTPKKKPFADIFSTPGVTRRDARIAPPAIAPVPPANPRVICGMTVWQTDPNVDPKIRLSVPDSGRDFKIRRIRPSACAD
jgi:hypothetical protein